jgi:hypothetical protein
MNYRRETIKDIIKNFNSTFMVPSSNCNDSPSIVLLSVPQKGVTENSEEKGKEKTNEEKRILGINNFIGALS